MFWKRFFRYFIPSPASLTLTWAALVVALLTSLFTSLVVITSMQAVDVLFAISFFSLPPAAFILVFAAIKEKKAGPRAGFWIAIAITMFTSILLLSIYMSIAEGTSGPVIMLCCAPVGLVPSLFGLFFLTKALPELREHLQADRVQRAAEILSARGEATYDEIALELDMPEEEIETLLTKLQKNEERGVVFHPAHKRAYTLTNLLEKHRRLQATIQARGQIRLSDLESELRAPLDLIKEWLYDLVNRGRLSGDVDWAKGVVYSLDLDHLEDRSHCPHCGGETNLVGKGMIRCGYCGVEIFIPKVKEVSQPTQKQDVQAQETPSAFFFEEPKLPPTPQTGTRFRRLRDLFKLSKNSKRLVNISIAVLPFIGLCLGVGILASIPSWGYIIWSLGLPVIAFFLIIGAFVEKRTPPRALLWGGVTIMLIVAGLQFIISLPVDSDTGFEFSIQAILIMVAPVVFLFSLPALYFGFKSWDEVSAVLQWQLEERALKLIGEKGEISFAEIAHSLQIPFGEVDNLVDKILRAGKLQGTLQSSYQRVYTAERLAQKRKAVLELVAAEGQIHLDEISTQLQAPYDLLRDWIYQLVQLHQFNGYINWDDGLLFSLVAEQIADESQCPNCGGKLGLTGDVILCQHCGSEIFRS